MDKQQVIKSIFLRNTDNTISVNCPTDIYEKVTQVLKTLDITATIVPSATLSVSSPDFGLAASLYGRLADATA